MAGLRPAQPARDYAAIATQYARDVVKGRIPAGRYVRIQCQRFLDELKQQRRKVFPFRFDVEKAARVCRFIERLPHTKGKWAAGRERIVLQPWQIFAIGVPFGWVHKDGNRKGLRRFRLIVVVVPRKNGKSVIAGGIGLYMLCADGEAGPEVYSGATTEGQAWEVLKPARLMAQKLPALCAKFGVTVNAKNLTIEADGGKFETLIGDPGDAQALFDVTDGNIIDYDEIYEAIIAASEVLQLEQLAYDPHQATMLVTKLQKQGVPVIEYRPTVLNFSEPMKELDAATKAGLIRHGGCPIMEWQMSNVVAQPDAKDNVYLPAPALVGRCILPCRPVIEVESVEARDGGGWTLIDPTTYERRGDWLLFGASAAPTSGWAIGDPEGIRVRYRAGSEDVPAPIRQAILVLTECYYRNRGSSDFSPPAAVAVLLQPFRVYS